MSLSIAFQLNLCGRFILVGKDPSSTIRGIASITASLSDTTNAYLADAGGGGVFYLVPRQNLTGGTPLGASVDLTLTVNAKDTVGNDLPTLTETVTLNVAPPAGPVAVTLGFQLEETMVPAVVPSDPGTATISVTS